MNIVNREPVRLRGLRRLMTMRNRSTAIAKLTRPSISGVHPRKRLTALLDNSRACPIVWISGPGGSGKTTLAADYIDACKLPCLWYQVDEGDGDLATFFYYLRIAAKNAAPRYKTPLPLLTPEYLKGIPVFTRRCFEELFRRLKPPTIIVFDNCQEAPLQSGFYEMMAHALDAIPGEFQVFMLSRRDPPPQLSRLRANNKLLCLGWDEIRFTREESGELLKRRGRRISDESLTLVQEKTQGWAAGLVLLAASADTEDIGGQTLDRLTMSEIFDYFANEIFNKTDAVMQEVLLKTAFFQKIEPHAAEKLTGIGSAGQILEQLSRDHYFTQRYLNAYEYHPLFREFLLARGKAEFSPSDSSLIRRSAAGLAEEAGRTEEAAALFIDAADWNEVHRLILRCAPVLLSQGRSKTLEGWLTSLPGELISASPWALYWLGMCRMAFDPGQSRNMLERAFDLFRTGGDRTGAFLSWAGIVNTFNYEWGNFSPLDRWIAVLEEVLSEHPQFPSPEIEVLVAAGMLNAMTYRQPTRADLPRWAERVQRFVLTGDDVRLRMALGNSLIFYYLWVGDFSKASLVIEALRPASGLKENDPLTRQNWYVMEAMYSWFAADGTTCMQAVTAGLENAENSGIHLLDLYLLAQGVYSGLSLGDPAAAGSCLQKMSLIDSPRLMDRALYQYQASAVAWHRGHRKKAAEHGKEAVKITEETGCTISLVLCLVEQAVTLFDDGLYDEADRYLARGIELSRGMTGLEFLACLHGARFAFYRGREKQGLALLKRGLALGARHGFMNIPRWNNRMMAGLGAKALEYGIETGYVRKLITGRGLQPDVSTTASEAWPWPLKIHTLGRFELTREGDLMRFSGKVQQKPLALLKALIALGGRDVTEEQFADILWPDADGDLAHKSFEMTVQRLRRLIGMDRIIQLQERRLSLDAGLCWVDVWELEDLIERVDAAWNGGPRRGDVSPEAARLSEKALRLYKGHFLPGDSDHAWALSYRERLRSKFLRLILSFGAHWEQNLEWRKAVEVFQKGLEVDGLSEEFYQHLMICHQQLGQRAEAVFAYHRCRAVLVSSLGIPPSRKTEDLYLSITDRI